MKESSADAHAAAAGSETSALGSLADSVLVDRAADGDAAAFAVLIRRHQRMMHAYARRLTSSPADADDAVQDALLLSWQRLPTLREGAKVRSWLMTIVGRSATDVIRRRRPTVALAEAALGEAERTPPSAEGAPAQRALMTEAMRDLSRALDALPTTQRLVWLLREVGGMSYRDIAQQVALSTGAVRGALARARHTLAREMEQWR